MNLRATSLPALLSVLLGCASEAPQQPSGAPPAVIPAQLPANLTSAQYLAYRASVECAAMFTCPITSLASAMRIYLGDYARCAARPDLLPGDDDRRRTAARVAASRLRFDPDAARRCLEGLRGSVCAEVAACDAVYVGATALGMPCLDGRECAGDAWCSHRGDDGSFSCPGVCAARVPLGAQCDGNNESCSAAGASGRVECQYDPARSGEAFPFRCTDRGAVQVVSEGAECVDRGAGSGPPLACAPGYDCVYRSTATGGTSTCRAPAAAGEECARYCLPGAVCEFDSTRFMQRCLPFVVRNREGDTCVQGNNGGEVCNVLVGLDCVAGHCRRVGTGAEGSVCFTGRYGVTSCNAGLFCSAATMTCQRPRADGAPCRGDDECASGACASDGTGVPRCVAAPTGCS
jgi:hypothetical protein